MVFIDRQVLRLAVHGGAGAVHDLLHIELHHDLHQVGAARHVVPVVLERDGTGLSDCFQGSEVNDAVNVPKNPSGSKGSLLS